MSESVRLNRASERRREELAEFLRTRRGRVSPAEVGLPPGGRRRTPGLRREEVALLANVGVAWYTSLEQGRDVRPSGQVLEGIAGALRLSPEERRHLFILADQKPLQDIPAPFETASPALQRVMDDLRTSPAYAISAHGDLAYWNAAADAVFVLSSPTLPPHERNLLCRLFVDPDWRKRYVAWEATAQAVLARYRADFAKYPGDARFEELVEDIKRESAEFREWWPRYDLAGELDGRKELLHPEVGSLVLEHTTLSPPADPDLKVMAYTPVSEEDAIRLAEVLRRRTERPSELGSDNGRDGQESTLA